MIIGILIAIQIASVEAQYFDDSVDTENLQPEPLAFYDDQHVDPIILTPRELEAVILSKGWQERYSPATLGRYGQVVYHYGESSAPVITSPSNVTQIQLQEGEVLVKDGIFVGDSVNWRIIPVLQGQGEKGVTHIIVKPTYSNLETTMIAITDRRSYYFHLKSHEAEFMATVGFEYPEIEQERWNEYSAATRSHYEKESDKNTIQVTAEIEQDIGLLDFSYLISGDNPTWKPVRVYNDGQQVFIQMPEAMRQSDAPAFIEIGQSNKTQIVNYRLRRGTYIIDKLFKRGMLISGTGRNQQKVVIEYDTR